MERNTILAMILCFLIYIGWQRYYIEPHLEAQKTAQMQSPAATIETSSGGNATSTNGATTTHKLPSAAQAAANSVKPQTLSLQTGTGEAVISNGSQLFAGWKLKGYRQGISKDAPAVDLESVTHQNGELSLAFEDSKYAYLNEVLGQLSTTPQGARWQYSDQNVTLTREFVASSDKPYAEVVLTAEFKAQAPKYAFVSILNRGVNDDQEAQDRQLIYWTQNAIERVQVKDLAQKEVSTPLHYMGATNRYFLLAVVAQNPNEPTHGLMQPAGPDTGRMSFVYPMQGNKISIPLKVFFGPKDVNVLRQVDPLLDHAIDFGWFTVFAYPLLKLLKWFYLFLQNYGLAIIFLTLLLKVATYPLTYKSMKSMKKMAKLQPQMQRIRERYKDDKQALNTEMLKMMKEHGYNPMAGCFPILIQMPIFFALYRVLYSSIELYHAPFALWIHDLSSRDPFYVTPVLLALTMYIQQKLTPTPATTDPAQAKIMQFMPLMFGAFMLALPSGLTIYMLANALAGIVQQMILNKKLETAPAR